MEKTLIHLKSKIVFNDIELSKIRKDVSENYPHLSSKERTFVFANKIRFKLYDSFEGVLAEDIETMTTDIIAKTLAVHQYTINKHHIYQALSESAHSLETRCLAISHWLYMSESIRIPAKKVSAHLNPAQKKPVSLAAVFSTFIALVVILLFSFILKVPNPQYDQVASTTEPFSSIEVALSLPLPKETKWFPHREINVFALRTYLKYERNSLLVDSEAIHTILHIARIRNIDPLLLFAIIGQEQGFVPAESHTDPRILNNPFNVFHSWEVFNTTLFESTEIAVYTIQKRMATYDSSAPPLKWLNGIYAEDPKWHRGVESLLKRLEEVAGL